MKTTKYTLVYLLLAICGFAFSQEQPTMLFFNENAMFYNPTYTGTYGQVATVNNRTQWAGITEAPVLQSFSYQSNFINKAAWGLSFQNDKVFIEKQGVVAIDYNYRLELSENSKLYLGLKGGAYFKSIDKGEAEQINQQQQQCIRRSEKLQQPTFRCRRAFRQPQFLFICRSSKFT